MGCDYRRAFEQGISRSPSSTASGRPEAPEYARCPWEDPTSSSGGTISTVFLPSARGGGSPSSKTNSQCKPLFVALDEPIAIFPSPLKFNSLVLLFFSFSSGSGTRVRSWPLSQKQPRRRRPQNKQQLGRKRMPQTPSLRGAASMVSPNFLACRNVLHPVSLTFVFLSCSKFSNSCIGV